MSTNLGAIHVATGVVARNISELALLHAAESHIKDLGDDEVRLTLSLSKGTPFRIFSLNNPARIVFEFHRLGLNGIGPDDLLSESDHVTEVKLIESELGWSRLFLTLVDTMLPHEVDMSVEPENGSASLNVILKNVNEIEFEAHATIIDDLELNIVSLAPLQLEKKDRFVVLIDPGHGGSDQGAERESTKEKELVLNIGLALRNVLLSVDDIEVIMTRDKDTFVSLPARVNLAQKVEADLFLSLHAHSTEHHQKQGVTVYTLSNGSAGTASEQLAQLHNRSEILTGIDLSGVDDEVTGILLDLTRNETQLQSYSLVSALMVQLKIFGITLNQSPRREASFSVLKSANVPSILFDLGSLSNNMNLINLRDPTWQSSFGEAIAAGILLWRD